MAQQHGCQGLVREDKTSKNCKAAFLQLCAGPAQREEGPSAPRDRDGPAGVLSAPEHAGDTASPQRAQHSITPYSVPRSGAES